MPFSGSRFFHSPCFCFWGLPFETVLLVIAYAFSNSKRFTHSSVESIPSDSHSMEDLKPI